MKVTRYTVRVKDRSLSNVRIYLVPDEETLYENFVQGRLTRPYPEFRKSGELDRFLREVMGYNGVLPKTRWSQKAGCSCGCSPGFIIEKSADRPTDYWVYYDPTSLSESRKLNEKTYSARASAWKKNAIGS